MDARGDDKKLTLSSMFGAAATTIGSPFFFGDEVGCCPFAEVTVGAGVVLAAGDDDGFLAAAAGVDEGTTGAISALTGAT
jgi:hypothetical protein